MHAWLEILINNAKCVLLGGFYATRQNNDVYIHTDVCHNRAAGQADQSLHVTKTISMEFTY